MDVSVLGETELLRRIGRAAAAQDIDRDDVVDPWQVLDPRPAFLNRTTQVASQGWCRLKAKTGNRSRLLSGAPTSKITWQTF